MTTRIPTRLKFCLWIKLFDSTTWYETKTSTIICNSPFLLIIAYYAEVTSNQSETLLSQFIAISTLEYGCKYTGEFLILWAGQSGRGGWVKGQPEIDWLRFRLVKVLWVVLTEEVWATLTLLWQQYSFGLFCVLWLHFPTATCSKRHVLVCVFSCNIS